MKKIVLGLNADLHDRHYLVNKVGDKFYFDPNGKNGMELDSFLQDALEVKQ